MEILRQLKMKNEISCQYHHVYLSSAKVALSLQISFVVIYSQLRFISTMLIGAAEFLQLLQRDQVTSILSHWPNMRQLFRMPRWRTAHPARQSDRDRQSVSTEESRVPIMLDFASIDLYPEWSEWLYNVAF